LLHTLTACCIILGKVKVATKKGLKKRVKINDYTKALEFVFEPRQAPRAFVR